MSTCVVDNQCISNTSFWQFTVLSKLIIIFTKRTCHINYLNVTIWISHIRDVVVGIVHSWTEQVNRRSIYTNIATISVLNMKNLRNDKAMRCCHETPKLSVNTDVSKTIRNKDFIKFSMNAFTDNGNIILFIGWCVVHSNTT